MENLNIECPRCQRVDGLIVCGLGPVFIQCSFCGNSYQHPMLEEIVLRAKEYGKLEESSLRHSFDHSC